MRISHVQLDKSPDGVGIGADPSAAGCIELVNELLSAVESSALGLCVDFRIEEDAGAGKLVSAGILSVVAASGSHWWKKST